tara:strand:+ start:183 stop:491 length:309 start_codon:yes stop_codon:yes gene_type:complete
LVVVVVNRITSLRQITLVDNKVLQDQIQYGVETLVQEQQTHSLLKVVEVVVLPLEMLYQVDQVEEEEVQLHVHQVEQQLNLLNQVIVVHMDLVIQVVLFQHL